MSDNICLEHLKEVVDQACGINVGKDIRLDTMCISSYERAISYLVQIGEAEWITKGRVARWVAHPDFHDVEANDDR